MRQSQQNLRYREIKENNPTKHHPEHKSTKPEKLSIRWKNGDKALFYYSYLISVKLKQEGDTNVMTLKFVGDTIVLKGYNLDRLFTQFESIEPHLIEVGHPRYAMEGTEYAYVTEVTLKSES